MRLRSICLVTFALLGCVRETPFLKGNSQGTIVANAGMKESDVLRISTVKDLHPIGDIGSSFHYGGSDSVFDFVLAGEQLRFNGCILYSFDVAGMPERRVTRLSMHGANESWPTMVAALLETESRLEANGWKPIGRCESLSEWTRQSPRDVPVTPSGTSEVWTWIKGSRQFQLSADKRWGGIPWWRNRMKARVFSRTMGVSTLDDEELGRILNTRVETLSFRSHVFGVRTPPGWSPDFVASGMEGQGFFHPECRSRSSEDPAIRLSVSEEKGGELAALLDGPETSMKPLPIAHPRFASFSRHVSGPDLNYYYVFLDPGESIPLTIQLVTYRQKPASAEDLAALDAIVRSIHLIEPGPASQK